MKFQPLYRGGSRKFLRVVLLVGEALLLRNSLYTFPIKSAKYSYLSQVASFPANCSPLKESVNTIVNEERSQSMVNVQNVNVAGMLHTLTAIARSSGCARCRYVVDDILWA